MSAPDPARSPEVEALLAEVGWVRRLALRLARDQAAAEDLAQGTLALALEQRPAARESLRPWLGQVVRRLALRQRRGAARRFQRELRAGAERGSEVPGSDELIVRLELQERLASQVRELPEPYRGAVLRRYYQGLSVAEISRECQASPATVRSWLARGRARLRQRWSDDFPSALPLFLLVAGSELGLLSRLGVDLLIMNTTTKLVVGTALVGVALVATGSSTGWFGGASRDSEAALTELAEGSEAAPPGSASEEPPLETSLRSAPLAAMEPAATAAQELAARAGPELSTLLATIVDPGGMPLAGAHLRSIYSDGRPRGAANVATADEAGRVRLSLADGDVRAWETEVYPMVFQVSAPGHATEFVVSTPTWHGVTNLGVVTLGPGGSVFGRVMDAAGMPMEGVVVYAGEEVLVGDLQVLRLTGPNTEIPRPKAESDEQGRFVLGGASPGGARIWAHAEGFLWTISEPQEVVIGGTRDAGILVLEEVPPELLVRGVVARPNGMAAAGASVSFESMGILDQEGSVTSDAEGRFQVVPEGEGLLFLVARDPEGRFGSSTTVEASAGSVLRLELSERKDLAISVHDPDGMPLGGAFVMPVLSRGSSTLEERRGIPGQDWIRTDEEGLASLPAPPEPFMVSASLEGYQGRSLGPYERAAAPLELTLVLEPKPRIEGRVLAHGAPVAGASIAIAKRIPNFIPREAGFPLRFFLNKGKSIVSDAEGYFALPIHEEWTDIAILARSDGFAMGELELTVEAGQGARGVVVEVTSGGSLHGSVLPPPGRVAEGLVVAASRGDGYPVWARADGEGRYRLDHLAPGNWRVEGRMREPVAEVVSVANRPEDKKFNWNVLIVDGGEHEFDVDMRGLGEIEMLGRFRIDGEPAAGWTASFVPDREVDRREDLPAVKLSSEGTFRLVAPAGRYDLRLVGDLEGGAQVEVLREVRLEGTRLDWESELTTALLSGQISASQEPVRDREQVRLVRGFFHQGDREIAHLPIIGGRYEGRVPAGSSSLQVSIGNTAWGPAWQTIETIELP